MESRDFAEKFKPGDEVEVPIWRPLVRAVLGANVFREQATSKMPKHSGRGVLTYPGWKGQYHGAFKVHLYVRAVGRPVPDRTERGRFL